VPSAVTVRCTATVAVTATITRVSSGWPVGGGVGPAAGGAERLADRSPTPISEARTTAATITITGQFRRVGRLVTTGRGTAGPGRSAGDGSPRQATGSGRSSRTLVASASTF